MLSGVRMRYIPTYPARKAPDDDFRVSVVYEPARCAHVAFSFVAIGGSFLEVGRGGRDIVASDSSDSSDSSPGAKHRGRPRSPHGDR